jgi:hypothetical protein
LKNFLWREAHGLGKQHGRKALACGVELGRHIVEEAPRGRDLVRKFWLA